MDYKEVLEKLMAPFPPEAIKIDSSRGFELTGIKEAYVVERLNQVFGPCGTGWVFIVKEKHYDEHYAYCEGALKYRLGEVWSEEIPCYGDCNIVRDRIGDATKGAFSDCLKKGASLLGVGHEAYKGILRPSPSPSMQGEKAPPSPPSVDTGWTLNPATVQEMYHWAEKEGGLEPADVLATLHVGKISDYRGSRKEAFIALKAAMAQRGAVPGGAVQEPAKSQDSWTDDVESVGNFLAWAQVSYRMTLADVVVALRVPNLHSYRGSKEQARELVKTYYEVESEARKKWVYEKLGLASADVEEALGMSLEEYPLGDKDTFKGLVLDFLNRKLAQKVRVRSPES